MCIRDRARAVYQLKYMHHPEMGIYLGRMLAKKGLGIQFFDGIDADVYKRQPLTTRYTIKRAFRDNYCLLRLTELQIYIIGLTGSDVARANTFEDEVDAEPAISYLGINLANLQEIMLAVLVEGSCKSRFYPVDVMLIHLRLHLEIAEVVDDSYLLSGRNALS